MEHTNLDMCHIPWTPGSQYASTGVEPLRKNEPLQMTLEHQEYWALPNQRCHQQGDAPGCDHNWGNKKNSLGGGEQSACWYARQNP